MQRSNIPFLWGFVIQPQKLKYFSFLPTYRDWLIPDIIASMLSSGHCSMVVQLDANLGGIQPHRTIEHIAAGEVKQRIRILVNVVVFYVYSVMYRFFVLADTHV